MRIETTIENENLEWTSILFEAMKEARRLKADANIKQRLNIQFLELAQEEWGEGTTVEFEENQDSYIVQNGRKRRVFDFNAVEV